MTTKNEALALALEALEQIHPSGLTTPYVVHLRARAITAIKQAQQAQEPVEARVPLTNERITELYNEACADWENRYDRPVVFARAIEAAILAKLVPLTDEQIASIVREAARGSATRRDGTTSTRIARAIEAAHGIQSKGGQQ